MLINILGILICLSPLLFLAAGYYIGRYGSPIVIKRQPRRDRRRYTPAPEPTDEANNTTIYTYNA